MTPVAAPVLRLRYGVVAVAVTVGIVVAFFEMRQYGPSYDSVWGAPQGEAQLHKLLTGRTTFTAEERARCPFRIAGFDEIVQQPERYSIFHGQFPPTVTALSCLVFHQELGWLGVFDAHNLPVMLASFGVLACVYWLGWRAGGAAAGAWAVALSASHPHFVANGYVNYKDIPVTLFLLWMSILLIRASESRRPYSVIGMFALLGLGIASKVSILIGLPAMLAWAVSERRFGNLWRSYRSLIVPGLLIAAILAFLFWPSLQVPPLAERFARVFGKIGDHSARGYAASWEIHTVPAHAVRYFLMSSPEAYLLAVAIGLGFVMGRLGDPRLAPLRLMLWLSITFLGVFSSPGILALDGFRYALPALPALAIVGGYGAARVFRALSGASRALVPSVFAIALTMPLLRVHPFELAYFNWISGGLAGAKERALPAATDYWALSYRVGARWINDHAAPAAFVTTPLGGPIVAANDELRPDLRVVDSESDWCSVDDEVILLYVTREEFYNRYPVILVAEHYLEPAKIYSVQGAPVLKIFREPASRLCDLFREHVAAPGRSSTR